MNAVLDNVWSRRWAEIGAQLEPPSAILCVSAHWETRGAHVTAMDRPRTIHDFSGFPDELNDKRYPAPGSPALARQTAELVRSAPSGSTRRGASTTEPGRSSRGCSRAPTSRSSS